MRRLSIVIPVYNEKNTISEILRRVEAVELFDFTKEIILVDDSSTDGTREILKNVDNPRYKIFYSPFNQGKGRAVERGFNEASGDVVLIQDADLEYDPNDYPKLLEPFIKGEADVVYGSRFLDKGLRNRIVYRRGYVFSRILNWFSNILSGLWTSDMYTGYKVFSREAVKKIAPGLKSSRFGIEPELTALVAKNKFRFVEVPVSYQGRTYQEGKKINWRDGLAALWHIIRFNLLR